MWLFTKHKVQHRINKVFKSFFSSLKVYTLLTCYV